MNLRHAHTHDHGSDGDQHPGPATPDGSDRLRSRLGFAIGLTATILVVEAIGGWLTGSLALLSDAGHVLTDLVALTLSYYALRIAQQPPDTKRTYGYHRVEVFAALVNGLSLLAISGWIIFEAIHRFAEPRVVDAGPMAIVAAAGLVANLVIVFLLHPHASHNLNAESAMLHVIGDVLASVAVLVGGVVMLWTGWHVIDPILSLGVVAIILRGTIRVLRESTHILLEGTPRGVRVRDVEGAMLEVDGVRGVHDLHIWSLCSEVYALSAHVLVDDQPMSEADDILRRLEAELAERYGIVHTTLQIETRSSPADSLLCNHSQSH